MKMISEKLDLVFSQATPEQVETGIRWYRDAYLTALKLSRKHSIPVMRVIGVIAALSPNNKWERNIKDTESFLKSPSLETKVCTFMGQRVKALAILKANSSSEIREILSGRKTVSFFDNMLKHDQAHKVTVDLWMYRMSDLKATRRNYEAISQAVIELSAKHKVLPHQFQAIVWSVVRPNKGGKG